MFEELLRMLFPWKNKTNSRDSAKKRLQLIIAHDRAAINSDMMDSMREEILEVVARYVDVDMEEMEFSLSSDNRTTSLTANLPIRKVKRSKRVTQAAQVKNLEIEPSDSESFADTKDNTASDSSNTN